MKFHNKTTQVTPSCQAKVKIQLLHTTTQVQLSGKAKTEEVNIAQHNELSSKVKANI